MDCIAYYINCVLLIVNMDFADIDVITVAAAVTSKFKTPVKHISRQLQGSCLYINDYL